MKILICNVGSTSLKFKLYDMPACTVLSQGKVERVGSDGDAIFQYENLLTGKIITGDKASTVISLWHAACMAFLMNGIKNMACSALAITARHMGILPAYSTKRPMENRIKPSRVIWAGPPLSAPLKTAKA